MAEIPTPPAGSESGQTPPPETPPPGAPPATPPATVTAEEHQRELDRYRNEVGQANKRLKDLETELATLKDAQKSEGERLQERAARADQLGPELESAKQRAEELTAALAEEVEAQKAGLPKEMLDLMPAGDPREQLAWIRKAKAAAEKLKPASGLPPAGGRSPAHGNDQKGPTDEERAAARRNYASRF